jgi:RNA polymerase primary sigma factor
MNDWCLTVYLREVGRWKPLSREEQNALAQRVKAGDQAAREQLINASLRMVVGIARSFAGHGLALLDLIAEGNIGLMKAVDRFDPDKGGQFIPFAAQSVRLRIRRALENHSRTIRLPVSFRDRFRRLDNVERDLWQRLARVPTTAELAAESRMSVGQIETMREAVQTPLPIAERSDDECSSVPTDALADERQILPDEQLARGEIARLLAETLQTLPPLELAVLRRRFGFENEQVESLAELRADLGLSREGIRQLQNRALRRLRCRLTLREYVPTGYRS